MWAAGVAGLGAPSANAQVVFAPVRFQFDRQNPFYYAGDDARVFRRAASPVGGAGRFGRVGGYDFVSGRAGRTDVFRSVATDRPQLYTDAIPGYNAFIFGLTVDDVRNEANARVARYYTKADLLAAAIPTGPTTAVVPPTPPSLLPPHPGPRPIFDRVLVDPNLLDRPAPGSPVVVPPGGSMSITPARRPSRPSTTPPIAPATGRPLLIVPRPEAKPDPAPADAGKRVLADAAARRCHG